MNFRITVIGENQTSYSWVEELEPDQKMNFGVWNNPFPNTEEESTAFGIVESILQSDYCPQAFFEEQIISVKIERVE